MDVQSKYAIKILNALANSKQQFVELSLKLRTRPDVVRVLNNLECSGPPNRVSIEGYIDVELVNGKAVAWWLEVNWDDEKWIIESRVLLNDNHPQSVQEVIREFSDRMANTLNDCIQQMREATSDLVNSVESILDLVIK